MIAVVGATLAGLAVAARLARLGHEVTVFDSSPGPRSLLQTPLDPDPSAVVLPAAWRDLFKKTGRTLDAALARRGLALTLAPPRRYETPRGTFELPHDRAGQWHYLESRLGTAGASAWRDLLDRMDATWLALRPLGIEGEFSGLDRTARARLRPSESIADLAAALPTDLAGIVTELALRRDSLPRRTPGWLATRLSIERTFGVWQVTSGDGTVLPAQTLVDLLIDRLAERGAALRWNTSVESVRSDSVFAGERLVTQATVLAINPWRASSLVGGDPVLRLSTRKLAPAATAGPRWEGWRTLLALPPLATGTPAVYAASEFSPAGPEPWAQLLTGALASYRVHADLTGEDARPSNKQYKPPPLPRARTGERRPAVRPQARTVISTSTNMSEDREPE